MTASPLVPVNQRPPSTLSTTMRVIVGLGIGLRLLAWAANRPVWIDEASLIHEIQHRTFSQLAEKLGLAQGAPYGFLVVERVALLLWGDSEFSLRLPSLVVGCLTMPLFAHLALRWTRTPGLAATALAAFAVSQFQLQYASEVKPYIFDTLFAIALPLQVSRDLERGRGGEGYNPWKMAAGGAIAVWFSTAAPMVLVGCGWLVLAEWRALRTPPLFRAGLLTAIVWCASFCVAWIVSLSKMFHLSRDWLFAGGYLPLSSGGETLAWLYTKAVEVIQTPFLLPLPAATFALCALGVLFGRRELRRFTAAVTVALLAASAAHSYSIYGRLVLFFVPWVVLLMVNGLEGFWKDAPWSNTVLALCALLLGGSIGTARMAGRRFDIRGNARAIMEWVAKRRAPEQQVVVTDLARWPYEYYRGRVSPGLPSPAALLKLTLPKAGEPRSLFTGGAREHAWSAVPDGRVWLISLNYFGRINIKSVLTEARLEAARRGGRLAEELVVDGQLFTVLMDCPPRAIGVPFYVLNLEKDRWPLSKPH